MKPPDTSGFLSNYPVKTIKIRTNYDYTTEYISNVQYTRSLCSLPNSLVDVTQRNIVRSVGLASIITFATYFLKRFLLKTADSINVSENRLRFELTNLYFDTVKLFYKILPTYSFLNSKYALIKE